MVEYLAAMQSVLEAHLGVWLRAERQRRGWSLDVLAQRSGVSRAMISKIERSETSPTAALLGRLSGALGMTLSTLLAQADPPAAASGRVSRFVQQPVWRDPETGYLRRAVTPTGAVPELVRVELPPGKRVAFPAASYAWQRGQSVWVLEGTLEFTEGDTIHLLTAGDCLNLGPPTDCTYRNPSTDQTCVYLVALAG
jgi:transcriptional regulator with XRE-family HTH domain